MLLKKYHPHFKILSLESLSGLLLECPPPDTAFIRSIQELGLIHPVVLNQVEGKFEVLCGRRRLSAAWSANLGEIPALIYQNVTDEDKQILILNENFHRSENLINDLLAVRSFLQRGMNYQQTAEAVGINTSRVKYLDRHFGRLEEGFMAMLQAGTLKRTVARKIAGMGKEMRRQILEAGKEKGRITALDVRDACRIKQKAVVEQLDLGEMEIYEELDVKMADCVAMNANREICYGPALKKAVEVFVLENPGNQVYQLIRV